MTDTELYLMALGEGKFSCTSGYLGIRQEGRSYWSLSWAPDPATEFWVVAGQVKNGEVWAWLDPTGLHKNPHDFLVNQILEAAKLMGCNYDRI